MSLMKTLARVAVGVAVAKGAQTMMRGAGSAKSAGADSGLGGLLSGLAKGQTGQAGRGTPYGGPQSSGAGGLEDMLGGLLGGAGGAKAGLPGGLGGLLESLGGASGGSAGGLQDILGGLAKSAGAGGLLGGLANAVQGKPADNSRSFGEVLNSNFDATPEPEIQPSADQEAAAALMLRAMIQAAKSDGKLDDAERDKLLGKLGDDVDQEEASFVQTELRAPVDVNALVQQTPKGMEPQVYAVSVLGIDLDSQAEAKYLHELAQGYGLSADMVNGIHQKLGVQPLYA